MGIQAPNLLLKFLLTWAYFVLPPLFDSYLAVMRQAQLGLEINKIIKSNTPKGDVRKRPQSFLSSQETKEETKEASGRELEGVDGTGRRSTQGMEQMEKKFEENKRLSISGLSSNGSARGSNASSRTVSGAQETNDQKGDRTKGAENTGIDSISSGSSGSTAHVPKTVRHRQKREKSVVFSPMVQQTGGSNTANGRAVSADPMLAAMESHRASNPLFNSTSPGW